MNDELRSQEPAVGAMLPLLFTYRETVFGNGFVAEISAKNGRALCVHEPDGYWMYGINPGGMAAKGDDPVLAHEEFRRTFSKVLFDLADESANSDEFASKVRKFFHETNEGYEPDWQHAVGEVRAGNIHVEGLREAPADSPREIVIRKKHDYQVTVADNRTNVEFELGVYA